VLIELVTIFIKQHIDLLLKFDGIGKLILDISWLLETNAIVGIFFIFSSFDKE
jgi:hypothetical protein